MIICWWSGGVTSAVACKLAIDLYGKDQCKVIMLDTKKIFPLMMFGYDKEKCIKIVSSNFQTHVPVPIKIIQEAGITVPEAYSLGFRNNNCLATGCVQGGIGYCNAF